MIILRNEEKEIVNLFDTAEEFKNYIAIALNKMEEGMLADGIGAIFETEIEKQSFYNQLKMYCSLTCEEVEIK